MPVPVRRRRGLREGHLPTGERLGLACSNIRRRIDRKTGSLHSG